MVKPAEFSLFFELLMDWNEQKRHPRSTHKPYIAPGICIIFRMKSTKADQWLWAECGNHSLNSLSSLRVRWALLPFLPQIIETVPQARCDSLSVLPAPLFTVSLRSVYVTPSLVMCTLASACLRRACVASRRVQKEFSRTQRERRCSLTHFVYFSQQEMPPFQVLILF